MPELFHLTEPAAWEEALRSGQYLTSTRGLTLQEQGFIHCSLRHQVRGVAEYHFADVEDVVLLVIDDTRLTVPVRYEAAEPDAEAYPHIYGPLPVEAVTDVITVTRDAEGGFVLPT